jgi:hypothetical protein
MATVTVEQPAVTASTAAALAIVFQASTTSALSVAAVAILIAARLAA